MGVRERIEATRDVIREARAAQRALIDKAWEDEFRSLNAEEFALHEQLDSTIKAAQSELVELRDTEAASAASARAPNSVMD